jgi:protein-S-isoprenylcysteine O-methyltransferase Ste14
MRAKYKSAILVGMQVVWILFLLVKIPTLHSDLWAIIISFLGIILGFWAVVTMKLDNLNVTPDVRQDARLVIKGPYKIIRHPMYCAILLTFLPFVIDRPSIFLVIMFTLLLATLLIKLNYEEHLLRNYFRDYDVYSKHTWRLIPFIY